VCYIENIIVTHLGEVDFMETEILLVQNS